MQFGSVGFFKRIIFSSAVSAVIFAVMFSMFFGIKASSSGVSPSDSSLPDDAFARMSENYSADLNVINIPDGTKLADIFDELGKNGITTDDILNYIAENDGDYLRNMLAEKGILTASADGAVNDPNVINIPENAKIEEVVEALGEKEITSEDIIGYFSDKDDEYLEKLIHHKAVRLAKESEIIEEAAPYFESAEEVRGGRKGAGGSFISDNAGRIIICYENITEEYLGDLFLISRNTDTTAVCLINRSEAESFSDRTLRRIADNGFILGVSLSEGDTEADIRFISEKIRKASGTAPYLASCPENADSALKESLASMGFVYTDASPIKGDSWSDMFRKASDAIHDSSADNAFALVMEGDYCTVVTVEDIIVLLSEEGYDFR